MRSLIYDVHVTRTLAVAERNTMSNALTEGHLLEEAVQALEMQTEGRVKICTKTHNTREPGYDAKIELELHGQTIGFLAEIKHVDRRLALAQIKEQLDRAIRGDFEGYLPLLIAPFLTETMADECKRLNLPFVDTAGNLFLRTETTLLFITGRPRPDHHGRRINQATNPAGMKLTFALLCKPDLVAQPYRRIAAVAQVALGTVGPVLDDLEIRGFLRRNPTKTARLQRKEELLQDWVVQYPGTLRAKLNRRRYTADRERLLALNLESLNAYWGGEPAADFLTGYLKPEKFTMYVRNPVREVLIQGRMRLDPEGNIDILDAFWNTELDYNNARLAPPIIVYADLMMTGDPRNLETAKLVYDRYLKPATNS
ncbi:MAG: type IV toxin-antitoxin system AbiEi family antitoxin [Janthinobacterium lividum]